MPFSLSLPASSKSSILHTTELSETQQRQMQGPARGEEHPHAPGPAEGQPAEKQLCGEGPGVGSWWTAGCP